MPCECNGPHPTSICYSHPSGSSSVSVKFWATEIIDSEGRRYHGWDVDSGVHQRHHDPISGEATTNQTIFLRGYTISVCDPNSSLAVKISVMIGLKRSVEASQAGKQALQFGSSAPYSGASRSSTEQDTTGTGTSEGTQGHDAGMERPLNFDDSGSSGANLEPNTWVMDIPYARNTGISGDTLVWQHPIQSKIINPSALINKYILDNYDGATVALTHDDFKWMGMENSAQKPLNVVELAKYAIDNNLVSISKSEMTPDAWIAQRWDNDIAPGNLTPITPDVALSAFTETVLQSSLFALLIGIDKYRSEEIRDLTGAVADVDAVHTFLQKSLRIPDDRVMFLRNERATRLTIEAAIQDLGNNPAVKKDDPILIFYAGHGAEANAPPGWPGIHRNIQMLVPHDFNPNGSDNSKWGQGVLDVTFSHLLANLAAKKSDNITVILDCCHSSSGARTEDNDIIVRGIDLPVTYTIAQDLLRDIEPAAREIAFARSVEMTGLLSHVLLSACQAEQTAVERHGRGVFTSALLSLLQEKGVDKLTYKDVIKSLPDLHPQDPQCEGVHQYRYLFNSKVSGPQGEWYTIRASSDNTPGQYVLEAGEAHGITKNTEFAIFADRSMKSGLGAVVVSDTAAFTSSCKFLSSRDEDIPFRLADAGHALQTRVSDGQEVRFFVEENESLTGILDRMAKKPGKRGFRLVKSRDDMPDLIFTTNNDVIHFEITDKLCRDHGLTRLPFGVDINDSDALRRIVQSLAHFYWYLRHSNKESPLAGGILECMKLKETKKYSDFVDVLKPDPSGHNLNIDGKIMVNVDEKAIYGFKITNTMSVPLYVSMFYFDVSDLSISSYYPPGGGKQNVDVSIPPGQSLAIGYGASGTVPHTYMLREGQDVDVGFLKLFFSMEYLDLSGVIQGSPFDMIREAQQAAPEIKNLWNSTSVAIVQVKGPDGAS